MTFKIPNIGDRIPSQAVILDHPDYTRHHGLWEFYRHSHELTGGYEPNIDTYTAGSQGTAQHGYTKTYLVPHEKESNYDFARRVQNATPPRFVQEGISHLVGVLTQQSPIREYPPKLAEWTSSVTAKGETWQQWIATEVAPMVERYGHTYTVHVRPDVRGETLADQIEQMEAAGLPEVLCYVVTPEAMRWWLEDETGRMVACHYEEEKMIPDVDPATGLTLKEETGTLHWFMNLEGWFCVLSERGRISGDMEVIASGYWEAPGVLRKHLPVAKWTLDGPGPTETASLAQVKYFRVESLLTNTEYHTAFPMTFVPTDSANVDPAKTVKGEAIVGSFPMDAKHVPMILEPQGNSISHFVNERLPALEADALAPYGRQRQIGGNDSGVALAHIQENAINIYRRHSTAFAASEFEAMQTIAEYWGLELDATDRVEWPTEFGALDDVKQAETLTAFLEMEPGDGYKRDILRKMASISLDPMTDADHEERLKAWDREREEAKSMESEMRDAELEGMQQPAALNPDQMGGRDNGDGDAPSTEDLRGAAQ